MPSQVTGQDAMEGVSDVKRTPEMTVKNPGGRWGGGGVSIGARPEDKRLKDSPDSLFVAGLVVPNQTTKPPPDVTHHVHLRRRRVDGLGDEITSG
jgi:hypothetical protein